MLHLDKRYVAVAKFGSFLLSFGESRGLHLTESSEGNRTLADYSDWSLNCHSSRQKKENTRLTFTGIRSVRNGENSSNLWKAKRKYLKIVKPNSRLTDEALGSNPLEKLALMDETQELCPMDLLLSYVPRVETQELCPMDSSLSYVPRVETQELCPMDLLLSYVTGAKYRPCQYCGMEFRYDSVMELHLETAHLEIYNSDSHISVKHSNESIEKEKFRCEYCDKSYDSKQGLESHIESKHNAEPIEKKTFRCEPCNKAYGSRKALKYHYNVAHSAESVRKFRCEHCGQSLSTKQRLQSHIESIHSAESVRNFRCEYCGKSLSRKQRLQSHIRSVHT